MAKYTYETPLSYILSAHPGILPVVNRLGIYLGVGDNTVREAAETHGVNPKLLLGLINIYLSQDGLCEVTEGGMELHDLVPYLEATDRDYEQILLPNIERHFNSLLRHGTGPGGNLEQLRRFFEEMKHELANCARQDREEFLPAIMKGEEGNSKLMEENRRNWDRVEEKTEDLTNFFVRHLRGNCDPNLCTAVVTAVMSLGRDIVQNNRIRQGMLYRAWNRE